jgi:hypothetical protein
MTNVLVTFIIFVLFPGLILGFILVSRYLRYKETQTMIEHGITPPPQQPIIAMPPPQQQAPPMQQTPPMQQAPYVAPMPPPMSGMPARPAMQPPPPQMRPPMPPPPPPMPPRPSRAQLTWGFVLTGVGLGLTFALWPIGLIANSAAGESGVHFPLGLGPWMLAGFIPLFVGLALILAHVISQPEQQVQSAQHLAPPRFVNGGYGAPAVAPPPPSVATMPPAVTAIPDAPPPELPLFDDLPPASDETHPPG